MKPLSAALGDILEVVVDGESVTINGASVVAADIAASNGVVHVIDSVLQVEASEEASSDEAGSDEAAAEGDEAADEEAAPEEEGADEATEEGDDAADEEADPAQDAAPSQMDQADEGEDEANVAERSGRPRSQYKKVWQGINKPRTLCN